MTFEDARTCAETTEYDDFGAKSVKNRSLAGAAKGEA
jgi:hypothetical protein